MTAKTREEALSMVGRALYGEYWVYSGFTREMWELAKKHLPAVPTEASKVGIARSLWAAAERQMDDVIHWLQHEHNLDMSEAGFEKKAFSAFFEEYIGSLGGLSPTLARQAAIKKRILDGERPGRGGSVRWKVFCERVRQDCDAKFDDRTIQEDARKMLVKMKASPLKVFPPRRI